MIYILSQGEGTVNKSILVLNTDISGNMLLISKTKIL